MAMHVLFTNLQPTRDLFAQPSCQGTLALLRITSSASPMMTRDRCASVGPMEAGHTMTTSQSSSMLGCPWRNLAVLASGPVVQWMARLGEEQQPQLHRCLHHPDLLRADALDSLDPDQANTLTSS